MIIYGAPILARYLNKKSSAILTRIQPFMAIRAIREYRTIPTEVALLLASMVPFAKLAETDTLVYKRTMRKKRKRISIKAEVHQRRIEEMQKAALE